MGNPMYMKDYWHGVNRAASNSNIELVGAKGRIKYSSIQAYCTAPPSSGSFERLFSECAAVLAEREVEDSLTGIWL